MIDMILLSIIRDINNIYTVVMLFTAIMGIPTALVGVSTLMKNLKLNRKIKKEESFKKLVQRRNVARISSTIANLEKYKEIYNDKLVDSKGLVIDKKWNLNKYANIKSIDDLIKLKDVKVQIKQTLSIEIPTYKFLPNNKKSKDVKQHSYVDNYLRYANTNAKLFNGKLYALESIDTTDDKITFNVYNTNYFNFLNTCKILELLYESHLSRNKFKIDILDLKNRHVGIGINSFTVIKNVVKRNSDNQKQNCFIYHKRTSNVVESPNLIHVVPAGSYSPIDSIEKDPTNFNLNMENTIIREFCEEVLNTNYFDEITSYDYLLSSNDYNFCEKYLNIYYVGCGLEPYNTKMEILALNIIDLDEIIKDKDTEVVKKFISEHQFLHDKISACKKEGIDFTSQLNRDFFKEFFDSNKSVEGSIIIDRLTKPMIEQIYSTISITPSSKELFAFIYKNFDSLFDK